MPANPSSPEAPRGRSAEAEAPAEPMSRAERRAAARGKTSTTPSVPVWNQGKVTARAVPSRPARSYSNRRSGG